MSEPPRMTKLVQVERNLKQLIQNFQDNAKKVQESCGFDIERPRSQSENGLSSYLQNRSMLIKQIEKCALEIESEISDQSNLFIDEIPLYHEVLFKKIIQISSHCNSLLTKSFFGHKTVSLGSSTLSFLNDNGEEMTTTIYQRRAYSDIIDLIFKFRAEGKTTFAVHGSSGTGKTCLFYLILIGLSFKRLPIVFKLGKFCYFLSCTMFKRIKDLKKCKDYFPKDAWFLAETSEEKIKVKGWMKCFNTMVFFTSPNPDILIKHPTDGVVNLYLPLWDRKEMEIMFRSCFPGVNLYEVERRTCIWGCDISAILRSLKESFDDIKEREGVVKQLRKNKAISHLNQAFSSKKSTHLVVRVNTFDYFTFEATWASKFCLDQILTIDGSRKKWWNHSLSKDGWKSAAFEDLRCEVLKIKVNQQLGLVDICKIYSMLDKRPNEVTLMPKLFITKGLDVGMMKRLEFRKGVKVEGAGWFIYCTTPTLRISYKRWLKYAKLCNRIYYVVPLEYLNCFKLVLVDRNGLLVEDDHSHIGEFIVPLESVGSSFFDKRYVFKTLSLEAQKY